MLPVRLFCEAKYLKDKVGLEVVRNAVGVLNDVNERFGSAGATATVPLRRFQYRYSVFSASGFTSDAEAYALAQQISLIDLQGPAFGYVLSAAVRVTDAIRIWQQQAGDVRTQVIRAALRAVLDTDTSGASGANDEAPGLETSIARSLGDELRRREFWLGFPSAPYILALQPDDPVSFRRLLAQRVMPEARLEFRGPSEREGTWALLMRDELVGDVVIRFGLPEAVDQWVLTTGETERRMLRDVKGLLKSIVIFEGGRAVEIRFLPFERRVDEIDLMAPTDFRAEVFQHERAPSLQNTEQVPGRWTAEFLRDLLELLDGEGLAQATMIRQAIRQGGEITREQVLRFPEYQERTRLTGITRPVVRLMRLLQARGELAPDAMSALETRYDWEGRDRTWASGFAVPPEFLTLEPLD